MLDAQYPSCTLSPCTSIPGFTVSAVYWSSSTFSDVSFFAWDVDVFEGFVVSDLKSFPSYVRAVRGGS